MKKLKTWLINWILGKDKIIINQAERWDDSDGESYFKFNQVIKVSLGKFEVK
jgi:hypothetical protein